MIIAVGLLIRTVCFDLVFCTIFSDRSLSNYSWDTLQSSDLVYVPLQFTWPFYLRHYAVYHPQVLILSLPVQTTLVLIMLNQRKKGVKITDSRIRLTTEVLQGIRLLKLYAWERFYVGKITDLRKGELDAIRKSM